MPLLRAVARPMLASIYTLQGYDAVRRPERVASVAEPVVKPIADRLSFVPDSPEEAVRLNGAVQLVAGSLLSIGFLPRLSALAIAATLVPTTYAGHRFWEIEDEQERAQQRIHFLKNLSMLGGLLVAAADAGPRPSLTWWGRHAARDARREASLVARTAKATGRTGKTAGKATGRTGKTAGKATGQASKTIGKATGQASKAAGRAGKATGKVSGKAAGRPARVAGPRGRAAAGRKSARSRCTSR